MTGAAYRPLGKLTQGGPRRRRPVRVGRQTNLTPEISKRICDFIRAGNFFSIAARASGVSQATASEWLARGRGEDTTRPRSAIYAGFAADVDAAEAAAEATAVLHWRAAMPKDWHASEKWLAVRAAERWAPRTPEQINSGAFAGVQVNIGTSGRSSVEEHGQALSELLDEHPELISGTMQFLDQLLPVEGAQEVNDEDVRTLHEDVRSLQVIEAEEGSWREVKGDGDGNESGER